VCLLKKIAEALWIAKKPTNMVIWTNFDSEVWKECVEQDHSNQLMAQLLVTGFNCCCYIVSRAGSEGGKGRAIYMVIGKINNEQRYYYLSALAEKVEALLQPFYESNTIDEVME
jgi:hypothetical protein